MIANWEVRAWNENTRIMLTSRSFFKDPLTGPEAVFIINIA